MLFKQANKLLREKKYQEAHDIYEELYFKHKLDIYKTGLTNARNKLLRNSKNRCLTNSINRILFITAGLKGPTAGGGIATCFQSMIRSASVVKTNKVTVLYLAHPYYASGNYDVWKEYYRKEFNTKLAVTDVNTKNYGSQDMQRSNAALQYLIEMDGCFDTVVFHDFMGLSYYTLLAQKYDLLSKNLRIIISAHGNHTLSYFFGTKKTNTWNEKVAIFMERSSLQIADEVTTPSNYYAEWISKHFNKENCMHLPNIIMDDGEIFDEINLSYKDKEKQLIVFYGRLERLKGLDVFLRAILITNNEDINHNILFAGNSTDIDGMSAKEYIEATLKECSCEIKFQFNCKSEALYSYVIDNNGLCVFPTLGETSSCVVVECIQKFVPFIASDIPGIKELINPSQQETYLIAAGSVEALVDKITKLPVKPDKNTLSFNMDENKQNWNKYLSQTKVYENKFKAITDDLVTVIIPTCDRPDLLDISIASILQQSYQNLEVIVVDDASVENLQNSAIAKKNNVKYIYSPVKLYKGAACNIAAKQANGKYICFFDDDDIAKTNMIENYIKGFNADSEVDVFSGFADYFEHSNYLETNEINVEYTSLALGGGLEVNMHINFFGKGTFIIKKEKFNSVGGYEVDYDSVPMVDYRFYIKSALNGLKISIIPFAQYFYRKNSPNSLFYKNQDKRHLQYLAKKSIEQLMQNTLGFDIAKSFSDMIWHISFPKFD